MQHVSGGFVRYAVHEGANMRNTSKSTGQTASSQRTYSPGLTSATRSVAKPSRSHWQTPNDSEAEEAPAISIENVERRLIRVESILVLITMAAIAYGDYLVGRDTSLGYLYLIPLSYSALTQKPRTTIGLLLVCVVLRQWLGPLERSTWAFFIRDWALTGIFALVATAIYRLGQERHRLFEISRKQRDELLREVELAARVQRNLLSKNLPPTLDSDIAAQMSPAKVVGGDYYDFIPLEDGRTSIVIADVAGKGLPAALLMPAVKIALRALVARHDRTEDILHELNTALYETIQSTSYATLFYGTLDADSTCIRYTNAGHLPALLLRADTQEVRWLATGGLPVGLLPDVVYETEEVALHPGDILLLYTDGVTEAQNRLGDQFGRDRLPSIVVANRGASSGEIVEAVRDAVREFKNGRPQADDLTLIAVKVPERARRDGAEVGWLET